MGEQDPRLRSFELYLRTQVLPLGLKVNVELALKIEALQRRIADDARVIIDAIWSNGITLSDLLAELSRRGLLAKYIVAVANEMGEKVSESSAEQTLASALGGDMNRPGSRSALLAFQALARSYAEKYEEVNGFASSEGPYCPLCGSESNVMVQIGDEFRMVCSLCGYEWVISRSTIRCPYCGNSNALKIGLLMDRERRYGLAFCQECGSSWKIIVDKALASGPSSLIPLAAMAADKLRDAADRLFSPMKGGEG